MTARSSPKDLRMPVGRERYHRLGRPTPEGDALGVGEDGQRGWKLGSSPRTLHRCRVGRIVDRYRTENSDRKKLQVSDFIQTSVSHRT
jgi:hypothetical protein